jgi:hypothetical protein
MDIEYSKGCPTSLRWEGDAGGTSAITQESQDVAGAKWRKGGGERVSCQVLSTE